MNRSHLLAMLLWAGFTSAALAQTNSACVDTNGCANDDAGVFYPADPLCYPMISDQYAVQYKMGNGGWSNAPVRISYYGGTLASPFNTNSPYISNETSMSFVSIPAATNTTVYLRVTNLISGFVASDNVSVRPGIKPVAVNVAADGTAMLSTTTASNFNGEQFLLWWSDDTNGGSIQSLVFFLDPPYPAPTGTNVKTITTNTDLTNVTNFDTLIFQGTFALVGGGYADYYVPTNITQIYLAPGAWVQGKLHFTYSGGVNKRVYGPGVLDGSRFCYALRSCPGDPGDNSLSFDNTPAHSTADTFSLDGIVITDHNHAMDDKLVNGSVNNVKGIGWNSLNGGFRLGDNTTVSNVFLLCGDDSLMMWGTNVTVRNATVWQTYNGGVVNLGWDDGSAGDGCLIDGLYVVKTDWHSPMSPSFTKTDLSGQNNAVIASLMVPGTMFGTNNTPLFRNILVEDPPNVLFSLKILFPECDDPDNPRFGDCALAKLTLPSVLNLNIENLCTPAALQKNSIGFYTAKAPFNYQFPAGVTNTFTTNYTFTGSMNIGLTNVIIQSTNGTVNPLTSANAAAVAELITNGDNLTLSYGFNPDPCLSCLPQLAITSSRTNAILTWPTNFPAFSLEFATKLASPTVWQTNPTAPAV
ncbi:MAG TPA: hypothetical protein VMQ67_13220, partial [Candidatus Saccharimonadales bacterium]|nr:hypothetical protein [Candidatus Saccharimonadales bacterium]